MAEEKPEDKAAEEAEAKAAFAAGFQKIRKDNDTTPEDETKGAEPKADEEKAEQAPPVVEEKPDVTPKAEEPDKKFDQLNTRLRNLEGHIGGVMQKLNDMTASAAVSKPTDKAMQAALGDAEAMERLVKEFPEFKPIQKELNAIREAFDKLPKVEAPKQQVIDPVEIRETVKLDAQHPDWEEIVRSDKFTEFSLQGGPTPEAFAQMKAEEGRNPQAAVNMINSWAHQHPQWWADKGHALFSVKAADSSKLLTRYKEHIKAQEAPPEDPADLKRKQNQQRLARASTPTAAGGAPDTGVSDRDAFHRGFKRAFKQRS